ncbi:NAD-dependent succinate-semialdehyde dehydrogenase [Bradyrhizobium sp.]|uniref:NAD-dependent succinate-semialdehyde dehydrogenase n=1 Tax=Bradyrhizobium sp. TaxID=376 RepID=UPI0039E426D3
MGIRKLDLYIGGAWVPASSGETLDLVNPATGEIIAHVPLATPADLDASAASAAEGFATWRRTAPAARCAIILRAAALLRERLEAIAAVMSSEQGKPLAEARAETLRAAELIEWAAEEGRRTYGQTIPAPDGTRYLTFWEPVGPVLALTPWNFPLVAPARKVGSSLAAGCSCILKPSEITPLSAIELVRAFADAGLPAGVLNLVLGNPAPISRHLLEHDAVRAVTFTGSVPVGKSLSEQAGRLMKPALMELGGHSPVIVFNDVDVAKIAKAAVTAKFRNAGQVCTSPTRFYVQTRIYDAFVEAFGRHAAALSLEAQGESAGAMGPVVSERRRTALTDLIEDARAKGARVVTGGKARPGAGFFLEPTVLADVPAAARIMSEEPFGPVAVLNRFATAEEVLSAANALPFGLAAYLFTADIAAARKVSHGLDCGIVGVNSFSGSNPETPFGGNKDSGHGREGGTEGVREYMTLKFIVEGTL